MDYHGAPTPNYDVVAIIPWGCDDLVQTALDKWQSNQTALESQYKRTMRVVNLDDLSFNCLADSSKLYLCVKAAHI